MFFPQEVDEHYSHFKKQQNLIHLKLGFLELSPIPFISQTFVGKNAGNSHALRLGPTLNNVNAMFNKIKLIFFPVPEIFINNQNILCE